MAAPIVVNAAYSVDKKIIKKLNRCRHTLRKLDNIDISEEATNILCVFNGGLDTGVCREELEQIFSQDASIENIIMLPKRPYSFVYYLQVEEAVQVCNKLNGTRLRNGSYLYISYVKQVPVCSFPSGDFPPGLILKKDLISENYEKQLLELANWDYQDLKAENTLKHRRVKHFGYEFKYGINNVDPDNPLPERIPKECDAILLQLQRLGLISHYPDQLTINQYLPGQGIPPHIDTPSAFEDGIVSVSLGSQVVMDFQHPDGRHRSVVLPCRSVLIMTGESRYVWSHGITPRKSDIVPLSDGALTLVKREMRTSFTFRKLVNPDHQVPCQVSDYLTTTIDATTQKKLDDVPELPISESAAAELEVLHVHKVYNEIADHFSSTRHSPWPKVTEFLCSLPKSSLVADIGCGNGKYFGLNPSIFQIGSDRSENLVQICRERNFQAFVGDILAIPLRPNTFDASICIAVIHHLSTKKRRLNAVQELLRIVRPGGKVLIQVWAMEQEKNKQQSKYLKKNLCANNHIRKNSETNGSTSLNTQAKDKDISELSDIMKQTKISAPLAGNPLSSGTINGTVTEPFSKCLEATSDCTSNNHEVINPPRLAVHVNRTTFKQQDLLVPWTKKKKRIQAKDEESAVLHRFYHVFQEGELEELCATLSCADISHSYYDEGNWCVVLTKKEQE